MSVTIYHNPRCSKSRQTLALLESRGIKPKIVDYLVTPPTEAELKRLLKLLGISPRELLRTKEEEYKRPGSTSLTSATLRSSAPSPNIRCSWSGRSSSPVTRPRSGGHRKMF